MDRDPLTSVLPTGSAVFTKSTLSIPYETSLSIGLSVTYVHPDTGQGSLLLIYLLIYLNASPLQVNSIPLNDLSLLPVIFTPTVPNTLQLLCIINLDMAVIPTEADIHPWGQEQGKALRVELGIPL